MHLFIWPYYGVDSVLYITTYETMHNILFNNVWMWRHYMECMSIQTVNLHWVWRHSTFYNIHIDTNMDMDMECIINHMGVWRPCIWNFKPFQNFNEIFEFWNLSLLAWFRSLNIALIIWNSWNICLFKENTDRNKYKSA